METTTTQETNTMKPCKFPAGTLNVDALIKDYLDARAAIEWEEKVGSLNKRGLSQRKRNLAAFAEFLRVNEIEVPA